MFTTIGILIGYVATTQPQIAVSSFIAFIFLLLIQVALKNTRTALHIAIFCLPFTQAPTIKLLFRWRVTELIAWLLAPKNLQNILRCYKHLPRYVQVYVVTMILYFFYTFTLGIAIAPMIEVKVEKALEYAYHPILRTLLESARGFAIISLINGLLYFTSSQQELERFIKLFVFAGAVSGLYGLYQAAVIQFGLTLPLLPGTLAHEGYARPFSTFYEPTGLGSYSAASTLLALYLTQTSKRTNRITWLVVLLFNGLGLFISLSRAGLMGLAIGAATLGVTLLIKPKLWRLISIFALLALISVPVYLVVQSILADIMDVSLSLWWFERSMELRREAYQQLFPSLLDYPFGFGQGLYIFIGAGAAGFYRLIIEGGVLGVIFLVIMHISAVLCLKGLLLSKIISIRRIAPFLGGAYISSVVTTFNYINTTDTWIWFVWSLPAAAATVEKGILKNFSKSSTLSKSVNTTIRNDARSIK